MLIDIRSKLLKFFYMELTSKACEIFGLDPSKLEIDELLKDRCYRRLFNIVATDQTCTNSLFRPNLIKELYFLLQITPFIQESLRDQFLNSIEEWYNSNDHKKIQLSKNLQGKIQNILKTDKQQGQKKRNRPKTGVQWDSTLNPFLRPYTAKFQKSRHRSMQKQRQRSRERERENKDSQKWFKQSTNACTAELDNDNDETQKQAPQIRNIIDIEEQWERSQDFTKKYRTLHPEQEPTYEKLLNIIDRASVMGSENNSQHIFNPQNKNNNNNYKNKRKIQSAMINREQSRRVAEKEIDEMRNANEEENADGHENIGQEVQEEEDQENVIPSDPALDDEEIQFNSHKCFTKDKRSKMGNSANRMYTKVNGLRIVRPLTGKQANIIERLGVYSNLETNKKCMMGNEDAQFADQYHIYMKKKNNLKKEFSRKTQSIRMLQSAKQRGYPGRYSRNSKENIKPTAVQKIPDLNSKVKEIILNEPPLPLPLPLTSNYQNNKLTKEDEKNITHYNDKNFFKRVHSANLRTGFRGLHEKNEKNEKNQEDEERIVSAASQPKLTKNNRFISELKFDPLNIYSRDQYNQQILADIEKIKQKFGGKISASTQSLMKAMYIDTPIEPLDFQVPDKRFMMISTGEKKKKKKLRKQRKKASPKKRP